MPKREAAIRRRPTFTRSQKQISFQILRRPRLWKDKERKETILSAATPVPEPMNQNKYGSRQESTVRAGQAAAAAPALSVVEGRINKVTPSSFAKASEDKFSRNVSIRGKSDFIPIFFDANKNHPNTVSKSGLRATKGVARKDTEPRRSASEGPSTRGEADAKLRKIRKEGLPVMMVGFNGPWKILADFNVKRKCPASLSAMPGQNSPDGEFWWR